jgi:hypothetical protein
MTDLSELIQRAVAAMDAMTPQAREEMFRRQRESYVRAEMSWPKPKFKWVNGVKVYDSFEDYCND